MAVTPNRFGPGTFVLGTLDDPMLSASCQVQSMTVEWDSDSEDPIKVLCGDEVAGGTTFTASVNGTFLQDLDKPAGIVGYSWQHKGETVPFNFTPNSDIGTIVAGYVMMVPLNVGGDEYGKTMTSEFEWACVGEPTISFGAPQPESELV